MILDISYMKGVTYRSLNAYVSIISFLSYFPGPIHCWIELLSTGPRRYKTFLCSTQLNAKFQLLIKTEVQKGHQS